LPASETTLAGHVHVEGRPAADQDVLLFREGSRSLEGVTTTGADGVFRLPRAANGDLVVLAKLRGEVCTAVAAPVPQGAADEIAIDLRSEDLRHLRASVEGDDALPLTVRLDLVRVEGLPDWLIDLATLRRPGVREASFAEIPVADGRMHLRVRPGHYRIRGDRVVYDQARVPGPKATSVIVDRARLDPEGTELPGEEWGGFHLDVEGDVEVALSVRRLEDAEV
jgi:predicted lipid carrier protein YhbT